MSETPCALLVDDPDREILAPVALRLIRMGLDVLYTKWEDEARLLAHEADGRVGAVVATPGVEIGVIAGAQRAASRASGERETPVLLIGPEPELEQRDRLRKAGVSNVLFEPYDDGELRFVLNACMVVPSEIAPRKEPRAPANQLCWLRIAGTRSFGVLYTISARGAYVEMAQPLPVDTELEIEFDLEGLAVDTPIRVLYRVSPEKARGSILPCGIGVLFSALPTGLESKLRDFARERAGRYLL